MGNRISDSVSLGKPFPRGASTRGHVDFTSNFVYTWRPAVPAFIQRWERCTSLFHRGRIHFIAQFHHRKKTRKEETPPAPGGDFEAVITGTQHRNENIDRTSEVQAFTSENPGAVRVINHQLSPLDLLSPPSIPLPPSFFFFSLSRSMRRSVLHQSIRQ